MAAKTKLSNPRRTRRRIRVGDRVYLQYGTQRRNAVVVEDRGNLGVAGGRILRVRIVSQSPGGEREFEVPEDEVTRVA